MSCCARDSGSKLSKRSRASVWSKQLLRPRSDPIFHILSCLCNWWDFAHEDLLKQSRGRRGNLTTQHYPLGFASFVKHSSFGKQITRAQNPTRLLLVCVSVGLTPLLGMRGIFRVRYWKFTSLCRWTLQPGNIRSDPIRQNKSCSPVPRGCGGRLPNGKVGDASSPDSTLNPADSEFEPKNGTESVFQLLSLTVHHKRYFDS